MISDSDLAEGRVIAEGLMVDACVARESSGDTAFNPATGNYEPVPGPVLYEGKCRLQSVRAQAANPEAGGAVFTVERVELQVPAGTELPLDALVSVASAGNTYRVTGIGEKTHEVARRFNVEVVA